METRQWNASRNSPLWVNPLPPKLTHPHPRVNLHRSGLACWWVNPAQAGPGEVSFITHLGGLTQWGWVNPPERVDPVGVGQPTTLYQGGLTHQGGF